MKTVKGIMYVARWNASALAVVACLMLGACASQPSMVERPAGYWSQIEDFDANPPPQPEPGAGPDGTFHPYVQAPGDAWGDAYPAGGVPGDYDTGGLMRPGFDSFYYGDPFYATNPYLLSIYAPAIVYAPPPGQPSPPAKPPAPRPVTPPPRPRGATPPPRPAAPPPHVRSPGSPPVKN
jgi:hypothetical protein